MSLKSIYITPRHPPIMVRPRPDCNRNIHADVMWRKASIKMPDSLLRAVSLASSCKKQKMADWLRQAAIEKLERENPPC
jgi:hypothetical protein